MTTITEQLTYHSTTIPPEIFILICVFGMLCLILSFIIRRREYKIMLSAMSVICAFFNLYACRVLGWYTEYIPVEITTNGSTEVTDTVLALTPVITSAPLIFFFMGYCAFCAFGLFVAIIKYTQSVAKEVADKQKDETGYGNGIGDKNSHKTEERVN